MYLLLCRYDINSIVLSPDSMTLYSGSDEKIIRIFEAPMIVVNGLNKFTSSSRRLSELSKERYL
jgi:hypothetical protein